MEETAAVQQETQDITAGDVGSVNEVLGTSMEETIEGFFPSTPAPDRPAPVPQAHRATITGVSIETNKDQTAQWLKVSYQSLDNGQDDSLTVFLPQAYIDNPLVDATTLSTAPGPIGASGKAAPSDRQKYAANVRNSGKAAKEGAIIAHSTLPSTGEALGDGTLETLIRFATEQGHRATTTRAPRTFVEVAEYLNGLLAGTEAVALLLPQGGDGDFADRLRTKRFVSQTFAEEILKPFDPTKGKGYRRLWLNE
jgi:hypothetical protein